MIVLLVTLVILLMIVLLVMIVLLGIIVLLALIVRKKIKYMANMYIIIHYFLVTSNVWPNVYQCTM